MHWLNLLISAMTGEPVEQLDCPHPEYARDFRLFLLPEDNGWDAYEVCLNCNKEWHDT